MRLVAVTKTHPATTVLEALDAGQCDFGENYVQEALDKISEVRRQRLSGSPTPCWHMIGPLQSNKTRAIAEHFDWVHTVERARIAERLSEQRPDRLAPLQLCIQVNISGESTKSGVAPEQLPELAFTIARLPRVRLAGLMAIPAPTRGTDCSPATARAPFDALARLASALRAQGLALPELSMGMSDDFEIAIAAGATMVRVGSAIFGARLARAAAVAAPLQVP